MGGSSKWSYRTRVGGWSYRTGDAGWSYRTGDAGWSYKTGDGGLLGGVIEPGMLGCRAGVIGSGLATPIARACRRTPLEVDYSLITQLRNGLCTIQKS